MLEYYDEFRDYLQQTCGIVLGENKQYLVNSRINRIMAQHKIVDLSDLVGQMKDHPRSGLHQIVIDAMTTNETLWFRDAYPYTILKEQLIPELQAQKSQQPVRIWSAACSTGQEPYSISMIVEEHKRTNLGLLKNDVEIIATDLSRTVLDKARLAHYDKSAIERGLTEDRLRLFFDKRADEWMLKPVVKDRVRFQPLNLLDTYGLLGKFDIVCCRNVLIYFNSELKADILTRMHRVLRPGGYLMLGASETLGEANALFEMIHCRPGIIYRAK